MPNITEPLREAIDKASQGDIPWIIVLLVFVGLQWLLIKSVYAPWVDSKTEEIKRLVKERDRFQDIVLKNRLHTNVDEKGNPIVPASKDPKNGGGKKK